MWALCAPSQVLVLDSQNGLHLFHLLSLPLWIILSHTGSGLVLCLALAPGTLAKKLAKAENVPTCWGFLSCCPWMQDIQIQTNLG